MQRRPVREIPPELRSTPFTLPMAAVFGVTARQLQGDRFRQLIRGVHVCRDLLITPGVLASAVALVLPEGAVVAETMAALIHGADVRRRGDLGVEVTMLRESNIRRVGIRPKASYLEPGDVVVIDGVPVTSPVRTAFDLARNRDLVERVVGVDAMLNRGGCTLDELTAYIADRPAWKGIRWAREAVLYAEPKAESPMETRQRMRLVLAGLPRPVAQFELLDESGEFIARLDHAYVKWKVAPEYDGDQHRDRWRYDNERQERIRGAGWWHRRFTSVSIEHGWEAMAEEVRRALADRGCPATNAELALSNRFAREKG